MSRLIDVDALMKEKVWLVGGFASDAYSIGYMDALDKIEEVIKNQPTIEAKEVVHGEWVKEENTWVCSVCHKENACAYSEELERYIDFYCPKCGARMDGAE